MARRRHVQHRQQLAVRIKHRAGRTGQAGVAATKMLVLINAQGLALYQAGADAVGAFTGTTIEKNSKNSSWGEETME